MKRAMNTLLGAFDAVFDGVFLRACLKNAALAFFFYSFILFLVSRVPALWIRIVMLSLSTIALYSILVITFGALCRAIYLKKVRNEQADLNKCLDFAMFFAPAYIAIPAIMIIIGALVKLASALVFMLGTISGVGEILVGLFMAPVTVIASIIAFLFAASLFFTPAIIATEERGLVFTLRRLAELAEKETLRLFVYFLLGALVTLIFSMAIFLMVSIAVPSTVKLCSLIMEAKFDSFFISTGGYLVYSPDVLAMKNIPLTYHIGSLLLYMTCGFLLALVITPPAVYLCSASTLLYQIFAEDRKIRGYGEADDDLLT